ncbi:MAG: ankyrin repeat domain-containing protein [Candidatus Endonucleobacter sp. (ex Gigantidas childressi)]|nr:ankyrin repeat domain-containing protein [Candidatus Endonucleobacter sp. (ex Gigantidas childressi)]
MKNILLFITILLSSSSMACLNCIIEQFAELKIDKDSGAFSQLLTIVDCNCHYPSLNAQALCSIPEETRSELDELITDNAAMPKAYLSQISPLSPISPISPQMEYQFKKHIEAIDDQELRSWLCNCNGCEQIANKLFLLKDYSYFHYILCHTIIKLRHQCPTNNCVIPCDSLDENAATLPTIKNIITKKIKKLIRDNRPGTVIKYLYPFSRIGRNMAENQELESSPTIHYELCSGNKVSDSLSDAFAVLYMSKGERYNFNCNVISDNKLIDCLHLSYWWLSLEELKYEAISSKERIAKCQDIHSASRLQKPFVQNECPSEGIYFELNKLPEAIWSIATMLTQEQEQRYFLCVGEHGMGLRIKKNKANNIIICYYDPNDTLRHKKMIFHTADDLKSLRCDDFWSATDWEVYFERSYTVGFLHSVETKNLQKDCRVVCMGNLSAELISLLSEYGHYGHSGASFDFEDLGKSTQKEFLSGKNAHGEPALCVACKNGHLESVKALIKAAHNSNLEPDVKKNLLAGKTLPGTSALYMACKNGCYEIVKELVSAICGSDFNFDIAAKEELLAGKSEVGSPALYIACAKGRHDIIATLCSAICSSDCNFDMAVKAELLAGKTANGVPALYIVCQNGGTEDIKELLSAMCSSNFNMAVKAELLAGKLANGTPALYIACEERCYDIASILLSAICSSDFNLDMAVKAELLAGKTANRCPMLYVACENGRDDIVKILLEKVCSSNFKLNLAVQEELMAGKGFALPPLNVALRNGRSETVEVFLNAVLSSYLDLAAKERLLAAKTECGIPALKTAIDFGVIQAVYVFIDIVKNSNDLPEDVKDRLLNPYKLLCKPFHSNSKKSCILL